MDLGYLPMGRVREPSPVKLVVSVFGRDRTLLESAPGTLAASFGPIDFASEYLPFDHTDYYTAEFGAGLQRQILAFRNLIAPGSLAQVKRTTNELECSWMQGDRRLLNLDPGYISLSKLVLATTKDYSHRLYLGQGIYGEVTLHYRHGAFHPWEWTYPDYASERYCQLFAAIRSLYVQQLNSLPPGQEPTVPGLADD